MKKVVVISTVFIIIANVALVPSAGSLDNALTTIRGTYQCVPNPCTTDPCLPGLIWAVNDNDRIYYLVGRCGWEWGCENTVWNGYRPKEGDTVVVVGQVYEEQDLRDRTFYNIEVVFLLPGICPVEIIYGSDSKETELLRSIRDTLLSKSQEGRELIKLYYQWSPLVVRAMEADEDFKEDIKEMLDEILSLISQ